MIKELRRLWAARRRGQTAIVVIRDDRNSPTTLLEDTLAAVFPEAWIESFPRHKATEAFFWHERALLACVVVGAPCPEAASRCKEWATPLLRWPRK